MPTPIDEPFSRPRAAAAMAVIALMLLALVGRVAHLQRTAAAVLATADRQQHQTRPLPARRGGIFDRNGLMMAGTRQTRTLFADPKFLFEQSAAEGKSLDDTDRQLDALAKVAGLDGFELVSLLARRRGDRFVKLAEKVDDATAEQIAALDLPGLGFVPHSERLYPMGDLAAHVLGGVGGEGKGLEGLERSCDAILAGRDGRVRTRTDVRGRPVEADADEYLPPVHGRHVVLTIDATIQLAAEQELAAACEQFGATGGNVVVMDPKTGEILALANWPTFDPTQIGNARPEVRRNRALTDPYEPGSTMKPFTASAALAEGLTRPDEVFAINGPTWKTPYGRTITDTHPYDKLAMWDVLVKSSNVGMSMLGERMGNPLLRRALTAFGFGRPSGIDLPGEGGGLVKPLEKWGKFTTDSVAQGYEVLVTPLQMVRAMGAIANGGRLVEPSVVRGALDDAGRLTDARAGRPGPLVAQVVPAAVADLVRRILADVPIRGTATHARLKDWTLFGKTGTAHAAVDGKYDQVHYTASFLGGAPLEDPRLVICLVVRNPDKAKGHYGGLVAAPAASRILERALTYLQVPKSGPVPPPPPSVAAVLYDDAKAASAD